MTRGRECAESCIDYLAGELVRYYRAQQQGPPLHAAVDAIGFRVGRQLVERYARDRAPMTEQLEVMKFVCKEFWGEVFRKSVDNLRTNHRGTFVLRDVQFRWLARLSQNRAPPVMGAPFPQVAKPGELAADFLLLPCAIIRGAITHLGFECSVTANADNLPQVDFTIVIKQQP